MAAATAGAAAATAGEGMEPRALQYEQTLVSETQGLHYGTTAAGCPGKCEDRQPTLTRPQPSSAVETEVRGVGKLLAGFWPKLVACRGQ